MPLIDPNGLITSWNAGAQRLSGYRETEVVGRHLSMFYPDEQSREAEARQALNIAGSGARHEIEGWWLRKDGSCFWANVVFNSLRDQQGNLLGFAALTRDCTARKQHSTGCRRSPRRRRWR